MFVYLAMPGVLNTCTLKLCIDIAEDLLDIDRPVSWFYNHTLKPLQGYSAFFSLTVFNVALIREVPRLLPVNDRNITVIDLPKLPFYC